MDGAKIWWWVIGIIIVALLAWWLVSSQSGIPASEMTATSTAATSTTQAGGISGATTNGTESIPSANYSGSSVLSIAENLEGASTFGSWLRSTGVSAQLTGTGPYTVFVPTNGAISLLPAGTFSNLSAAGKVRFVEYHIIKGKAVDVGTEVTATQTAMSGDALNFSYGTEKIPMVGSAIIIAEYKGSNGVVYLIDNVLIPPVKTQI